MRRAVLLTAAVLLLVESLAFALIGMVMGLAARKQQMSIGGLSPDAMSFGAWIGQGLLAAFLLACAVVTTRAGLLGPGHRHGKGHRGSGRVARSLLVGCAVLHGLLGAVLLGLSGWPVFTGLMVVLAVVVLSLLVLREPEPELDPESAATPPAPPAADPQPA